MNHNHLRDQLNKVLAGDCDGYFYEMMSAVHCMSRSRVYAVINACVSAMEPGEIYVEVGTYQGGSLIAALADNLSQAIGVDNFEEFKHTNSYERTLANLQQFGVSNRVTLKNMGFSEFFGSLPHDFKIQVYYYDGAHDEETQLAGMEAAWPHLRTGSLVIVDDYTYPEVRRAINRFVANHINNIQFRLVVAATQNLDELYWNGIVVMQVV